MESLPSNFILQNVIDGIKEMTRESEGILKCNECEEDVAANFCCECYQKLCNLCTNFHQRSKQYKSHSIFELDQVPRTALYQGKIKTCRLHNEVLKYFCEDCNQSICHDCAISNLHKTHCYNDLEEVVQQNKKDLEILITKMNKKAKLISRAIHESEKLVHNTKNDKIKAEQIINETFEKIQDALNEKKEDLLKSVELCYENNKNAVEKTKVDLEIIANWAIFGNEVIDNRSNVDIMENYENLKSIFEYVSQMEFRKSQRYEQVAQKTLPTDCPRVLMRNPNSSRKPRLSYRRQRARSVGSSEAIAVDIDDARKADERHHAPHGNPTFSSFGVFNRELCKSLTYISRSSLDVFTSPNKDNSGREKKIPPPRPPPVKDQTNKTRRATVCSSAITLNPDNLGDSSGSFARKSSSKVCYVAKLEKKRNRPERQPPPPPPQNKLKPNQSGFFPVPPQKKMSAEELEKHKYKMVENTKLTGDDNVSQQDKTLSQNRKGNESVNDAKDSNNLYEISESVRNPEAPPRFFAGIKLVKQNIEVKDDVIQLVIDSLKESLKFSKQEKVDEVAYSDALFELKEDISYH